MCDIQPLDLTSDEKMIIKEYLSIFKSFIEYDYDDDIFDVIKRAEYIGHCQYLNNKMTELYNKIPQIVKDEKLIPKPNYPYYS